MKLLIYGDLHTEFEPFEVPDVDVDVIVLAGDIGVKLGGLEFAAQLTALAPVVYVAGNHEYYRAAIPKLTDKLRAAARDRGVHFLEKDSIEIGGVRFLGCTLWTDFMLFGSEHRQECMMQAGAAMTDFALIRRSPGYSKLRPMDMVAVCRKSKEWLAKALSSDLHTPTVIVTHHAPSKRSIAERHTGDLLSAAFANNFDELIDASGAQLWIHGHTHHCVDYTIGNTRVVSNQRGYPDEPVQGFRKDWVIEI